MRGGHYIYIHIYIYTYIYTYIHTHTHTHTYIYTYKATYIPATTRPVMRRSRPKAQPLPSLSGDLAFTRYCHKQYSMLNGKTGGARGNHILRNIDCEIHRGGVAIKEVLNAKNNID